MLLAAVPKPASAKDPAQGVVRTFAVLSNSSLTVPDFFDDESVGLVIEPPDQTEPFSMTFSDWTDPSFASTVWESRSAIHIMKGGAETLAPVVWLRTSETPEPPPNGAITFSGPDSPLILSQELFYYYDGSGGLHIQSTPGGEGVFYVVTAIFSR
jgi:hypothetical protein